MRSRFFVFTTIALLLNACVHPKKLVSDEAPTMKDIFEQKFQHKQNPIEDSIKCPIEPVPEGKYLALQGDVPYLNSPYLISPYLINPIMTVYIYPHLTAAGTPVPAYSTYFKLYEKDHVALPGEVSTDAQ